jgi:hypothetical protein
MNANEYEYEYHNLAESADYIEETNEDYYYDDGSDEPWMDEDDDIDWANYYHNLTDEIED